jgi:hypothetical protein
MRLDASYNLCSKLGSKLILNEIMTVLVLHHKSARPFSDFDCIFLRGGFFIVEPDKIYAAWSWHPRISGLGLL